MNGPVEKAGGQFFGIWMSNLARSMVELDELLFDLAHIAVRVIDASDRVLHALEGVLAESDHLRRETPFEDLFNGTHGDGHVARVVIHGAVVHEVGGYRGRFGCLQGKPSAEQFVLGRPLHKKLNEHLLGTGQQEATKVHGGLIRF